MSKLISIIIVSIFLPLSVCFSQGKISSSPHSENYKNTVVPACKDTISDPDGDGWGWENMSSCHVGSSFERTLHPDCKSSSSDPDGDGWGWENNASCKVESIEELEEETQVDNTPNTEFANSTDSTPTPSSPSPTSDEQTLAGEKSFSDEDQGMEGLLEPNPGSTITAQNFNLRARVNPNANRYKVFIGSELREHSIFDQKIAQTDYFYSDFQEVKNGLVDQKISLNNSALKASGKDLWITVVSFIKASSPEVENYKFALELNPQSNPTVIPPPVTPITPVTTTTNTLPDNQGTTQPVSANLSNLSGRVKSLLNNGYRIGFGRNATGGNERLVTVTNNKGDNSAGSLRRAVASAQSGDYIIFAPSMSGRTINLEAGLNVKQANITIDGRIQGGGHVKIVSDNIPIQLSVNASNVIVHFLEFQVLGSNNKKPSIMLRIGKNIWLDAITVRDAGDDAITLGFPPAGDDSADLVTVTRYHAIDNAKGLLINTDGWACQGVTDPATGKLVSQNYNDQRRGRMTVAYAHMDINYDRNLRNSGGFLHAFNIWADNVKLGMQAAAGAETILESAYYDLPNPHKYNFKLTFHASRGGASQHAINLGEATHIGGPVINQNTGIPTCGATSYLFMDDIEARGQGNYLDDYIRESDESQVIVGQRNFGQARIRPFDIPYSYELLGSTNLPRELRNKVGVNSEVYE